MYRALVFTAGWVRIAVLFGASIHLSPVASSPKSCDKPLYLTFDTGHMEVAPLIADVLKRQQVLVTFFVANELTKIGDGSLGDYWAPWWPSSFGYSVTFRCDADKTCTS